MEKFLRDHIEKIVKLTDEEFDFVKAHFTQKTLRKRKYLVEENNPVHHEYLVYQGCLKAYVTDEETGREHIFQFAMEDWWITDRQAFLSNTKATINVESIEDCTLWALSLQDREKLCAQLHKMEHFFNVKASHGYVALQQRIIASLKNSTKQQYEQLLKAYPQLFQRVPKTLIASYLGITRETLSRLYSGEKP